MQQKLGDALRHQRLSTVGHTGDVSPSLESQQLGKKEELETNPWSN
jgi:hypothetical protein